jgi:DNA-binding NarL/FixJ family response regulator
MPNILVADDHSIVANGIINLLEKQNKYSEITKVSNATEVLEILSKKQYDLLITDISMPQSNQLDYLKDVLKLNPDQKIMIFSMHEEIEYVNKSISIGVHGYVSKEAEDDELVLGVDEILNGDVFYCKRIVAKLTKSLLTKIKKEEHTISLTNREREILKHVKTGMSTKDIAKKLFLSDKTISVHRSNLMKKLNAKNAVDLINITKELGI